MADAPLDLAAEFPDISRDDWRAAVDKVLRGKPFDVLVSESRDGLDVQPLYTADDGHPAPAGSVVPVDDDRILGGWDVRQQHRCSDPSTCNRAILDDLERGVTSIEILPPVGGWTSEILDNTLAGVLLDIAPVALSPHADLEAARSFTALIAERGDSELTGSWLGLDPIGELARGGDTSAFEPAMALAADLGPRLPGAAVLTVDSTRYADAGATDAQELAWSAATGLSYLRGLEAEGLTVAQASSIVGFRMTAGADQFVTIATMRAARLLWGRILEAGGVPDSQRFHRIQAVTSRSMFSRRDPWVNVLRSTSAALGAGVGGADAITVLPFNSAIGDPDRFARRNSRNIQLLLLEESHLGRLADPAGGSWFVESLTTRLADEAWSLFQEIEASGGMERVLAAGSIQAAIDNAWSARLDRLATRAEPVTGVSEFPVLDDDSTDLSPGHTDGGLPLRRLAAPFEQLRDAADRATADRGQRPPVFVAALGDLATHTARSTWVSNLLAVGGVVAVGADLDGADSPLQAGARFTDSGCSVAVICSSDGVYADRAVSTATALKEAGAIVVALAGRPGERADEYQAAGVDEFWHVGIDVLDTLGRLHSSLGIS